jgi:nicotinamide riboside kinase
MINNLIKIDKQPFIMGEPSTGKSNLVKMLFKSVDSTNYQCFPVQLSYGVKSKTLQQIVESYFEKRNNK